MTTTSDNADWYLEAGTSKDQLFFEYDSTSTWTNAVNSLAMMDELTYESAWLLPGISIRDGRNWPLNE